MSIRGWEGREYWEYREPTPEERAEIKAELEGAR
jgi:hypothetical protein